MNKTPVNVGLILAIIFASSAISGSLVFFGMQVGGKTGGVDYDKIMAKVEQGVESYVSKQQERANAQQEQENAQKAEQAQNVKKLALDSDHLRGNKNAPITLVEYSDFMCPYCASFHFTAKKLVEQEGDKVNWVYRHWPLPGHDPYATRAAEASECVAALGGDAKFWDFADAIFEARMNGKNVGDDQSITELALKVGVNAASFKSCFEGHEYLAKIKKDIEEGDKAGVNGTPGNILLNNSTGKVSLVDGNQSLDKVVTALNKLLNE